MLGFRRSATIALVACLSFSVVAAMMSPADCQTNIQPQNVLFLTGTVVTKDGKPLADARVGLLGRVNSVQSDQDGNFKLPLQNLAKTDSSSAFGYVEFDKDGYVGATAPLTGATKLDIPLRQILLAAGAHDGRAVFSDRLPLKSELPPIAEHRMDALIPPESWTRYFARLRKTPLGGPTGQATFEAFIPTSVNHVRAIFLMTRHGIGSVDQPRLRAFAERNQVGLVAVTGKPLQRGFFPVDIIDPYLARLGSMLSHPEIATVPMITFGHSNGTAFSGMIASQRSDRVIAWISYHSGESFYLQYPGSEKVPSLVMHGLIDPFFGNGQVATVDRLRQEINAPVTFTVEPFVPHFPVDDGQNATWDFITAYAEAAIRVRLSPDGAIKPVAIESGWLGTPYNIPAGGLQNLEIAPYASYPGDRRSAVWLPDEIFARIWQRYEQTDPRVH